MGNANDSSPETAAATAFGVLTSAVEYAKEHLPEFVEELESRQLAAARRLVNLADATCSRCGHPDHTGKVCHCLCRHPWPQL